MRAWSLAALLSAGALALPAGAETTIEYVVEPGQTLWSIAAKSDVYDDPYLWPLIYRFNRDQIQDPARIYEGQTLLIPIDVPSAERMAVREAAGATN